MPKDVVCHYFDSIESTNQFLSNRPFSNNTELCVARQQTHGKGQYGRTWQSQKDGSILFSIRRSFPQECNLNGLSLVVGLAIIKALEAELSISGMTIKWPNDIYYDNKKLAGILLENQTHSSNQLVVIGVGINYALNEDMVCETPWIDLTGVTKTLPDIKNLTTSIINHILILTERFELKSFADFQMDWERYDMLKGKQISFEREGNSITAEVLGVSSKGALKVFAQNKVEELYSSRNINYI
ncbi:MAG TPA: biotin--[acetyl-CoA-carboxylase] ligase [Gammaproteobacteria bacterium]|nr:biotin--[acetyl-CoA-carboxylase] ligase [Gammaproteobacteria bacterium]